MHDWLMVINSNGRYSTILYTIIYIYRNSYCNVNVQYAMLLQYSPQTFIPTDRFRPMFCVEMDPLLPILSSFQWFSSDYYFYIIIF